MNSCVCFISFILTLFIGALNAHPDHDHDDLPEEPTHLYVPEDQTDIFAIQLDTDELEQEEELDHLEHIQAEEQKLHPKKQ